MGGGPGGLRFVNVISDIVRIILDARAAESPGMLWVLVAAPVEEFRDAVRHFVEATEGFAFAPSDHLQLEDVALAEEETHKVSDLMAGCPARIANLAEAPPTNDGDRALLQHVRMAIAIEGTTFAFTVPIVNASLMDGEASALARQIVAAALDSCGARIHIVIEVGERDSAYHLALGDGPGSRFRISHQISAQGLVQVSRPEVHAYHLGSVERAWDQEAPIAFFLGAGFSYSSGLPLGDEMRDRALHEVALIPDVNQAIERLYGDLLVAERADGASAFLQWERDDRGRPDLDLFAPDLTLERLVTAAARLDRGLTDTWAWFNAQHEGAEPGPSVRYMAELVAAAAGKRLILFTVNFDEMLERACSDELEVIYTPDRLDNLGERIEALISDPPGSRTLYVKLHGSLADRETIVVDYDKVMDVSRRPFASAARRLAEESAQMVYVGHSMRDYDIRAALADLQMSALIEHWVAPTGPDPVLRRFWNEYRGAWRNHAFRFSHTTADQYFGALSRRICGARRGGD